MTALPRQGEPHSDRGMSKKKHKLTAAQNRHRLFSPPAASGEIQGFPPRRHHTVASKAHLVAGFITRRSQVQILSPQPNKQRHPVPTGCLFHFRGTGSAGACPLCSPPSLSATRTFCEFSRPFFTFIDVARKIIRSNPPCLGALVFWPLPVGGKG